jgi:C4-type Zn-finger protein
MSSYSQKWLVAAQQVMADPKKPVTCPFCEAATLQIHDANWQDKVFERWITCPNCKETTALHYRPKN